MTSDEIKSMYNMSDICARYGIQVNRSGFICCPFHKEKNPSMKINKDSYHCFGCQKHGDIFDFVMKMDNLTFKEAFKILGGTYGKINFALKLKIYQSQKQREMRNKEKQRISNKKKLNNDLIDIYRRYMNSSEPFSDVWCDCYNKLQYQLYIHGEFNDFPY